MTWAMFGGVGLAGSTTWGPTGLLHVPTADANPEGRLDVGFHQGKGSASVITTYGLLDTLEVGMGLSGLNQDSNLSAHVKFVLISETFEYPGVAIGVSGVDHNTYYMVASKRLQGLGVRGHVGIGKGRVNGLFAGVSKVLNPVTVSTSQQRMQTPVVTLIGEWDGSGLNAGADLAFTPELGLRLMLEDMESFSFGLQLRTTL